MPDRYVSLMSLFRQVNRLMVTELIDGLHALGYTDITPAYLVFENIDRHGTRVTELAARAEMTHPSMSELVSTMERRGYVERRPDPTDGRARLVCLTGEGQQIVRISIGLIADIEARWTRRLNAPIDWRETLDRALRPADDEAAHPA